MTVITLHQLAEILHGQLIFQNASPSPDISLAAQSLDSRTLKPGDLFWALAGQQSDGHQHVDTAFQAGAAAAVISKPVAVAGPCLLVADVPRALWHLAAWHRQQQEALLMGVTGSVGKTTTRHLLHQVLTSKFVGMQSLHNFNNHLGTPLSLLQLTSEHEFGAIEMAASAQGEIAALAELVQPEIGVITHICPAHLEQFRTLDNISRTKAELLSALPESGLAVLPEHVAALPEVRRRIRCRLLTVGFTESCDVQAHSVRQIEHRLAFSVGQDSFQLQAPGKHFLNSALITLAIARELGMSAAEIQQGFDQFQPLPGRCQLRRIGDWQILDDSYNASPTAMVAGLEALKNLSGVNNRIAVLGDMLSLGEQAVVYHRRLGQQVARFGVDHLLVYGEHSSEVAQAAVKAGMSPSRIGQFEHLEQLQDILSLWLTPDTGLLLKASRNMQAERLLPWLEEQAAAVSPDAAQWSWKKAS